MYKKDVNIGSIIKKIVDKKMTTTEFSRLLGYENSRSYVYSIFNSKSIDTNLLIEISHILNYPFLLEYFEEKPINRKLLLIEADASKIEEVISKLKNDISLIINKLETTV